MRGEREGVIKVDFEIFVWLNGDIIVYIEYGRRMGFERKILNLFLDLFFEVIYSISCYLY